MTDKSASAKTAAINKGQALYSDGEAAWWTGDYTTAAALLEQSLSIFQEHGEQTGILRASHVLANIAYSQGDYAMARVRHEQVLQRCQDLGLAEGVASSLNNLGLVAMQQRDYPVGQAFMQESLRIYRELAMEQSVTAVLHNLGGLAMHQGEDGPARAWLAQSLIHSRDAGDTTFIARNLTAIANLAAQRGEYEKAAQLWSAAESLNERPGTAFPSPDGADYTNEIERVRAALGVEKFAAAWNEGHTMPLEQVLELALQETE